MEVLKLYEKKLLQIHEVLQHVFELFISHPDLLQQFHHFFKPTATSTNGLTGNYSCKVDTMMNSIGNVVLCEYDEYLLSQFSQTEDDAILDRDSLSHLSQEVVNLATQDPSPVTSKEEFPAHKGKSPS